MEQVTLMGISYYDFEASSRRSLQETCGRS